MSQLARLEARREALVRRCGAERVEIARLIGQLRPRRAGEADGGTAPHFARHPLAVLALLGGLALFGRTREVLSLLLLIRSAVSLAGRVGQLLRRYGRSGAARAP